MTANNNPPQKGIYVKPRFFYSADINCFTVQTYLMAGIFFQGVYETHVTVTDNESGEELQCFDIELEVQLQEEECTGWFCMFG